MQRVTDGGPALTRRGLLGLAASTAACLALVGCKSDEGPHYVDGTTTADGLSYKTHRDGTAELTGADGDARLYGDLTVPGTVSLDGTDYTVTSVADGSFDGLGMLQALVLPASVTNVGKRAFRRSGVSSVSGWDGVTTIGQEAFSECDLTEVTLPGSLTSLGEGAFSSNEELASVAFEDGQGLEVGKNAFRQTPKLEEVRLPAGLRKLGMNALGTSTLVTHLDLPDGLEEMGEGAIYLQSLEGLAVPGSVREVVKVGPSTWKQLTTLTIGDGVQKVERSFGNSAITELDVPGSVTEIGEAAFSRCLGLATLTLHEGTKTIGDDAFVGASISSVTIPDTVTDIGKRAFSTSTLTSVHLGAQVRTIGERAFMSDRYGKASTVAKIQECNVPDGVTSIGDEAFKGNDGLELAIPASVTDIGKDALLGCVVTAPKDSYAAVWCQKNGVELHEV